MLEKFWFMWHERGSYKIRRYLYFTQWFIWYRIAKSWHWILMTLTLSGSSTDYLLHFTSLTNAHNEHWLHHTLYEGVHLVQFFKTLQIETKHKKSKYIERFSVSPFQFPERVAELLFKEKDSFTAMEPVAAIDLGR